MDVCFVEDDDLLKKYNTIWNKISADIENNKEFYNKEFLKSKKKQATIIILV